MKRSTFLTAATIVAVMGALVAVKSFAPASSAAPAQHRVAAPAASAMTADMRPIVPSPVIDPSGEVFVGTGDGAAGAWVKP
jgi:hypothetical protein